MKLKQSCWHYSDIFYSELWKGLTEFPIAYIVGWKGILHPKLNPAGIYLFKVNIGNTFHSQWNLFKVGDEDTTSLTSFWCLYCQLWTDCSFVSVTEFEQVNAGCYWNVTEKLLKCNAVNCDYKK